MTNRKMPKKIIAFEGKTGSRLTRKWRAEHESWGQVWCGGLPDVHTMEIVRSETYVPYNEEKEKMWEKYLIDKPIIKFCKVFGRLPTQEEIAQLRNELEKTK